ncbi:VOC family protein [Phytohabitans kaempferiae]|uniref:VOC family protein n=1 Tax=Phytohabitans kaempferiae TaxID=1620943 RepID=A0ABV6MI88_9ACTN
MSRLSSIVIHCRDPYVAAPFWSLAFGLPPVAEDRTKLATHSLDPSESVLLRDPSSRLPDVWVSPIGDDIDARGRGLVHIDLQLDDLSELDALVNAGATRMWEVAEPHRWTVMTAPDGILFCAHHPRLAPH